jgi:hypothetical protein
MVGDVTAMAAMEDNECLLMVSSWLADGILCRYETEPTVPGELLVDRSFLRIPDEIPDRDIVLNNPRGSVPAGAITSHNVAFRYIFWNSEDAAVIQKLPRYRRWALLRAKYPVR